MENWRDVPGYEGLYLVSDMGRVLGLKRGLQHPTIDEYGYPRTALCRDGAMRYFPVHRLVAMAFIPNPENKPTANHINEIKTDNRVCNLEWATVAEQNVHGTRLERVGLANSIPVVQVDGYGNEVVWSGASEAARALGISRKGIRDCCNGRYKTAGGFEWRNA